MKASTVRLKFASCSPSSAMTTQWMTVGPERLGRAGLPTGRCDGRGWQSAAGQWATDTRKSGIEPGDRIFFLRQGVEPRGIIGSGTAASRTFTDEHWDDERSDDATYVLIEWDTPAVEVDVRQFASRAESIVDSILSRS